MRQCCNFIYQALPLHTDHATTDPFFANGVCKRLVQFALNTQHSPKFSCDTIPKLILLSLLLQRAGLKPLQCAVLHTAIRSKRTRATSRVECVRRRPFGAGVEVGGPTREEAENTAGTAGNAEVGSQASSPDKEQPSATQRRQGTCGNCGALGHNRAGCTELPKAEMPKQKKQRHVRGNCSHGRCAPPPLAPLAASFARTLLAPGARPHSAAAARPR